MIKISDEDRNKATRTAYETAVKRLKQARRNTTLISQQLNYRLTLMSEIKFVYMITIN